MQIQKVVSDSDRKNENSLLISPGGFVVVGLGVVGLGVVGMGVVGLTVVGAEGQRETA